MKNVNRDGLKIKHYQVSIGGRTTINNAARGGTNICI
jgi:hypothetical protein